MQAIVFCPCFSPAAELLDVGLVDLVDLLGAQRLHSIAHSTMTFSRCVSSRQWALNVVGIAQNVARNVAIPPSPAAINNTLGCCIKLAAVAAATAQRQEWQLQQQNVATAAVLPKGVSYLEHVSGQAD